MLDFSITCHSERHRSEKEGQRKICCSLVSGSHKNLSAVLVCPRFVRYTFQFDSKENSCLTPHSPDPNSKGSFAPDSQRWACSSTPIAPQSPNNSRIAATI